jgi:hypothetical protein
MQWLSPHRSDRYGCVHLDLVLISSTYVRIKTREGLLSKQRQSADPALVDAAEGDDDRPASYHRYLYAFGNPLVYVDPDGESSTDAGALGA